MNLQCCLNVSLPSCHMDGCRINMMHAPSRPRPMIKLLKEYTQTIKFVQRSDIDKNEINRLSYLMSCNIIRLVTNVIGN